VKRRAFITLFGGRGRLRRLRGRIKLANKSMNAK
jgi:hypothetical protein